MPGSLPQSLFPGGGAVRGAGSGSRSAGTFLLLEPIIICQPCVCLPMVHDVARPGRCAYAFIASSDNESGAAERLGLELLWQESGALATALANRLPNRLTFLSVPLGQGPLWSAVWGARRGCRLLYTGRGKSSCLMRSQRVPQALMRQLVGSTAGTDCPKTTGGCSRQLRFSTTQEEGSEHGSLSPDPAALSRRHV
jgi:hypothetical protein